jgi:signal recognition particle GTPase
LILLFFALSQPLFAENSLDLAQQGITQVTLDNGLNIIVKTDRRAPIFISQKLGSGLTALLLGKKSIDDDLLEALEMLLIGADIGINTTDKVLESVRKNASRKTLKDTDSLYQFLKDELAGLLIEDNQLKSDRHRHQR